MTEPIKAWHFLASNMCLENEEVPVLPGRVYSTGGPLKLCINGMHASKKVIDAMSYAPGSILCRVELSGEGMLTGHDRLCAYHRRVLWMFDATEMLQEFACQVSENALELAGNPDPRSVAAIVTKRKWLSGKATDEELTIALNAAKDAESNAIDAASRDITNATTRASASAASSAIRAISKSIFSIYKTASWAATATAWAISDIPIKAANAAELARDAQEKLLLSMITKSRTKE